ncbi:MAG: cytochrome C oxidase subunit IV family protein [Verrucomicrobiales bacterium]|jgi:hypothetical protein|nr:cytochrome C oxidase subunit IV family protein [Verrucomicrobiales bacterium]MBP9224835.1 cytochrome C oxidase subunit IV family protein [Verrucomicrobiales bacterium]HQZ26882.1 cytochrome C oxidase subunit IV family protein [Verrucomicrobiales bacterium]
MTRNNIITWIVLVALTTLGFFLGEHRTLPLAILAVAGVKGFLVARQFMELRSVSFAWTIALAGAFGGILALSLVLS